MDNYLIRGKSSTKINGVMGKTFAFEFDDFDDVTINMGGGNDTVSIKGTAKSPEFGDLDFTDDLTIDMGTGSDIVNLKWLEVKGNFVARMGDSSDKLNVLSCAFREDYNVFGGSGTDKYNRSGNIWDGAAVYDSFETRTTSSSVWW